MPRQGLKFISGKYQGAEFPLPEQGEILIGRSGELDMMLAEDMVSRKHAKIVIVEDGLSITDLGSTNGTFVNGEKVRRTNLKLNDRVLIGTSILKVVRLEELSYRDEDRELIKKHMEDVATRAPSTTSMSGDLQEVPLPDLLQLFATNKKSGILTISGGKRGKVFIKAGQLKHVSIAGEAAMRPMKALCRMVAWTEGAFRLDVYDEAAESEFTQPFEESTESVLMEALRQLDELKRLMQELPPVEAKVSLCVPLAPKLSSLNKPELDTLQAALNFNHVKQIVDKSECTDYEAATSIMKLLRDGFLEVE